MMVIGFAVLEVMPLNFVFITIDESAGTVTYLMA
jgi:hypothetical protein